MGEIIGKLKTIWKDEQKNNKRTRVQKKKPSGLVHGPAPHIGHKYVQKLWMANCSAAHPAVEAHSSAEAPHMNLAVAT